MCANYSGEVGKSQKPRIVQMESLGMAGAAQPEQDRQVRGPQGIFLPWKVCVSDRNP